jgi:hypothetical protein
MLLLLNEFEVAEVTVLITQFERNHYEFVTFRLRGQAIKLSLEQLIERIATFNHISSAP